MSDEHKRDPYPCESPDNWIVVSVKQLPLTYRNRMPLAVTHFRCTKQWLANVTVAKEGA